jgi:CRISPR system Cascade subunit CasB
MQVKNWKIFVEYMKNLYKRDDKAALAALRRGVKAMPNLEIECFQYIYPGIRLMNYPNPQYIEKTAFMVGVLFALWHSGQIDPSILNENPNSFGDSFYRLKNSSGGSESLEKRFTALLNAHKDDLSQHLRHIVGIMRSNNIPINWEDLAKGIDNWTHPKQKIQVRWARDYWSKSETSTDLPTGEDAENDTDSSDS